MDDIRAKRLAKLQSQSQSQSPASTPIKDGAIKEPSTKSPSTPSVLSPDKKTTNLPLPSSSTSSSSASLTNSKRQKPEQSSEETFKDWITQELEHILQVTLDHENSKPDVIFLESTFTELVEEEQDLVFTKDLIDRAIIERLSEIGVENPFRYLKDAWAKSQQTRRIIKQKDTLRDSKLEVLDEIERLSSSYGLVSFQIPDMFINGDPVFFIKEIISNENSYGDFLIQIIKRSDEEGTKLDFLNIFVPTLSKLISNLDLNNPQHPLILNIFQLLLNEKSVASVFTQIDGFEVNTSLEPSKFETTTILGPIFRLSPLQDTVSQNNFDRLTEKSKLQIKQIGESLQAEHRVLLNRLFFIADKIIRGSEKSRNDLLQYFASIINKNHLRRGDHSNFVQLSSNAFVTNISLILIRLSQPFLDQSFSKLDRIDIDYFNKSSLIDITDETRINSTTSEATTYFTDHKSEVSPNFISDCFYLTLTYLHYGIGGTFLYDNKLKNRIKQLETSINQVRSTSNTNNPMQRFAQLQIPKLEKNLANLKSQKDALVAFFIDRDLQLEIFDFIAGASVFLIRLIDPQHKYPQTKVKIPLIPDIIGVENADNTDYFREKAPIPFKYFPEFVVEGLVNYVQYISKYVANPLVFNPRLPSYVEFAVTYLRCPELIGNPHLKGRLVETLFIGSLPTQDSRPGYMADIFDTNELVSQNLLYSLLDFYVVVEKTGSSSQFYDKFNSRYHISQILEQIWKNPFYQNQLVYQSDKNEEFFIRFVARMLNDLTFLLDESLRQLSEVHSLQIELESRKTGISNIEGTDEELQGRLSSAESHAKSDVGLANKSIQLFNLFTKEVPRAFVKSELVGRLASMLDYNLDALVGPKCSELKVRDPEKYSFNPKNLLLSISKVYVNLSHQPEFVVAVSQDSRSFKRSLFTRAENILKRWGLASSDFIDALVRFADDAEAKRLSEEEEELELGDVPDEFLDPLMFTLMKDPVILPSSRVSIDLATIKSHLLSDSTDPFNRIPLKLEDVIPDVELKKRIEDFKAQSKVKKDVTMTDA